MSTAKSTQSFLRSTHRLALKAQREGTNIKKAEVTKALETLTKDGRVSKADVKAARGLLDEAPLTAGAKDALKNFVQQGARKVDHSNSPLNLRLRGGESSGSTVRGGESSGRTVRGGGEGSSGSVHSRRGGGEATRAPTHVRGGGEAAPSVSRRGGGESRGGGASFGGGSYSSRGGGE